MKRIDFRQYETDAHSYSGSDDKRKCLLTVKK